MPKWRSRSTIRSAPRPPPSTTPTCWKSLAASNAMPVPIYRINGRDVRARDVQILFADASTGARSPALVHQGRIGEIIQAKPEQRRRVLEEAAGVAGLHARRHEAELRLKAAETNLTRAEDVIGQLAAQMEALKKQARQAVRYRNVSAQVRKAEATLYHLRHTAAAAEVAAAAEAKDQCVLSRGRAHRRRRRKPPSGRLRPRPPCLSCAKRKRAPAPHCTGSTSRSRISTARSSARATGWPSSTSGWCSSPPTASANSGWPPTPRPPSPASRPRKKPSAPRRARTPAGARASTPRWRKPTASCRRPKRFSPS